MKGENLSRMGLHVMQSLHVNMEGEGIIKQLHQVYMFTMHELYMFALLRQTLYTCSFKNGFAEHSDIPFFVTAF